MSITKLSSEDLRSFVDLLPVGTMLSRDRVLVNINTPFAQMFGYRPDELIGKSIEVLYPTHRDFVDRGEMWREFLSAHGEHCDERMMLQRGDRPIRMRVKGRCKDRANPYGLVVCAFELIPASSTLPRLSERERSIVAAMEEGLTSKEIARLLGLSHRTVETYRQRMMTRAGARNASQLLAKLR